MRLEGVLLGNLVLSQLKEQGPEMLLQICFHILTVGLLYMRRYKMAEKNLLEVMKAKGAVYKSPILRPELRLEARKQIGDTGLLDHLLKHMAGKVAPGGAERFRRRHNAEGVLEYWLESADLVDIRREAGVQDPYWTPPPGWKTGDCPSQDPICAKEMKELKEETSKLERSNMKPELLNSWF